MAGNVQSKGQFERLTECNVGRACTRGCHLAVHVPCTSDKQTWTHTAGGGCMGGVAGGGGLFLAVCTLSAAEGI